MIKYEFKCIIKLATLSSPYLLALNKVMVNQLWKQKSLEA